MVREKVKPQPPEPVSESRTQVENVPAKCHAHLFTMLYHVEPLCCMYQLIKSLKCDKTISNVPASYAGGLCGRWIFAEVLSHSSSRKIKNVNVCVPENLQTGISDKTVIFGRMKITIWS